METQAPPTQPRYDSIGDLELHVAWLPDIDAQTNIKNVIQLLCGKLSLFGEESLFMYINKGEKSHGYSGSEFGKKFLQFYPGIPQSFQQFYECHSGDGAGNIQETCEPSNENVKQESNEQHGFGMKTVQDVTQETSNTNNVYDDGEETDDYINDLDNDSNMDDAQGEDLSAESASLLGNSTESMSRTGNNTENKIMLQSGNDTESLSRSGINKETSRSKHKKVKKERESSGNDPSHLKGKKLKGKQLKKVTTRSRSLRQFKGDNTTQRQQGKVQYSNVKKLRKNVDVNSLLTVKNEVDMNQKKKIVNTGRKTKKKKNISEQINEAGLLAEDKTDINTEGKKNINVQRNTKKDKKESKSEEIDGLNSLSEKNKNNFEFPKATKRKYVRKKEINTDFSCKVCGKVSTCNSNLKDHMYTHKDKLKCHICGIYIRFLQMRKHFRNVHKMENFVAVECRICSGKTMMKENEKSEHVKSCRGYTIKDADEEMTCNVCDKVFRIGEQGNYHRHVAACKERKTTLCCTICRKTFESLTDLKSHHSDQHPQYPSIKQFDTESLVLQCFYCGEDFMELKLLKAHLSKVHEGSVLKIQCKFCDRNFKYMGYKNHVTLHNYAAGFPCHVCLKVCKSPFTLKNHLLQHVPDDKKPYHCKVCGKGFPQSTNLRIHSVVHTAKQYICDICGHPCRDNRALQIHHRIHTGERPYKCTVCDARFRAWQTLKQHKIKHEPQKRYMCDLCGNRYAQVASLLVHRRRHVEKARCDICDVTFTTNKSYEGHFIRHHLREEQIEELGLKNVLKCKFCGKLMECQEKMTRHMRVHTGEKPFSCKHCGKAFADERNLYAHIKIHTNDRKHKCTYCDKRFIQRRALRGHLRSCHGIIEEVKSEPVQRTQNNIRIMDVPERIEVPVITNVDGRERTDVPIPTSTGDVTMNQNVQVL